MSDHFNTVLNGFLARGARPTGAAYAAPALAVMREESVRG